ncbi:MAG: metalloregulator ArsR/SmtB family transcription factor [Gammaproteobacteria bacterium]|jgi:ArsR family transcriptional regulator, arsenate/arsenite/antimonite-responsive transcriptional repressor|nr:metalloregulator ArsR/SmtB family transcription factor [Gammaproteobacteria bacterium]MBU0773030.1 metalloregulator ArsR/SmtB family transcription factor [Gammaproteobacteria bacterium]MBU0858186.1 metalloregulator ArsR/SmtB family transcription factor [Gammaproteobacteria bacterium]MBU1846914.1 metalloregulator ArsR/SmtB family transcription factor [Gammaproteobacteria bacterium]
MDTLLAAELLAALGHESRLTVFRLLVEAGTEGLCVGPIGEATGMAPATLSFHLRHLSRVGLIAGKRESRFIRYSANYESMDELLGFLTRNCCQGQESCFPKVSACGTTEQHPVAAKTAKA